MRVMAQVLGIKLPPLFRASPNNPTTPLSNPAAWLTSLFAPRAKSGAEVSPESVISLSAVWRAVSIVSQSLAVLPFEVIEEREDGSVRIAKDHDIYPLLRYEPGPMYTSYVFLRSLVAQACFFGNGYATIRRDERTGRPVSLQLIDQTKTPIEIFQGDDAGNREILYYKVGSRTVIANDILHIQNLGFNGLAGNDILKTHRDNYGLALAARDFGNTFFKQGSFLSGYLQFQKGLTPEAMKKVAQSWRAAYSGQDAAGKVAILDEGAEFKPLNMKPSDASMLETQKFSLDDVARITGVPPHLLYSLDRATFNNIEHLGQEFANYTLMPWATQLEQEFSRKLFKETEKRFTRSRRSIYRMHFDMSELLRADADSRARLYQSGIQTGWLQPNEARMKEGLNPVEGGNANFIQMQYITLEKAAEQTPNAQPGEQLKMDLK